MVDQIKRFLEARVLSVSWLNFHTGKREVADRIATLLKACVLGMAKAMQTPATVSAG